MHTLRAAALSALCISCVLLTIFLFSPDPVSGQQLLGGGGSGGSTGAQGYSVAIGVGGGTQLVTHGQNTVTPLIGQAIINSGCGTCYSIGTFTANTFIVTSTQAVDMTLTVAYAAPPPPDFTLSVGAASISPVFQNQPNSATFLITATGSAGYSTTLTPTLNALTGVSCTFSPATMIFSGSTATTTGTCPVTGASTSNTTAGSTNTLVFHATDGTTAHDAAGVSLLVWTSPVQQWLMNEGTSPMADSSGHTNDLTNTAVTFTNVAGMLTNTPTYNGSTSKSVAANFTNTNFTNGPFSGCIWFRMTAGYTTDFAFLAGDSDSDNSLVGWELGFSHSPGTNQPLFLLYGPSGTNNTITYFTTDINSNAVHHMCGTYDGSLSATGVKMYLDGAALSQASTSGTFGASLASGVSVTIGQARGAGFPRPFTGNAADKRVFGYVLSASQVSAIYTAGVF